MIEEARMSLEAFLKQKESIELLKMTSLHLATLRREWLCANPQYREYDLNLGVVWDDVTPEHRGCLCCEGNWPRAPTAKGFHVEIKDHDWARDMEVYQRVRIAEQKLAGMSCETPADK